AVHDPGYPAFVIAGLLLLGGVVVIAYLRPATVFARLVGTDLMILTSATRTGRGAWDDISCALGALGIEAGRDERFMKPTDTQ
ncbi:MAG: hypothetical protein MUC91_02400, partial [Verrucomicrobia bacterium]|nr:hypothetical protein [Verrucomicrobiota bacterium]